jgi:3-hydroxyacyl-CoA dehydrogenase
MHRKKMINTSGPTMRSVALVGTGVIGQGWIQVFSRSGCRVHIYDKDPAQVKKALNLIDEALRLYVAEGLVTPQEAETRRALVSPYAELKEAVSGVEYVQESGPERLDEKRAIFGEIDRVANPSTIIASSTSSLDISEISNGLSNGNRCIMVHPFNPPHVIPVVEVLPAKWTDPAVVARTVEFLKSVGQKPLLLGFYVKGFLLNRIQAAVVREAIHLVEKKVADVDAIDTGIRDGLGLRWAILGTFGVNNTNAEGGVREYYSKFGDSYRAIMDDLGPTPPSFDPEMIERIARSVDVMEGAAPLSEVRSWRDRMVQKIRTLKEEDPHP